MLYAWTIDEYNHDFREAVGVDENDILVLQGTRVVKRKAIELAIDVVAKMNEKMTTKKAVIVVLGIAKFQPEYVQALYKKATDLNVTIKFVNDIIQDQRVTSKKKKIYSIWDAYPHADIVSYPSILEGFGNQFLEAVFAKKPIILYEYPVYRTDIKPHGFDVISLGGEYTPDEEGLVTVKPDIIEKAAIKAIETLDNDAKRNAMVEKNFALGKTHFSYDYLEKKINTLCFGYCEVE